MFVYHSLKEGFLAIIDAGDFRTQYWGCKTDSGGRRGNKKVICGGRNGSYRLHVQPVSYLTQEGCGGAGIVWFYFESVLSMIQEGAGRGGGDHLARQPCPSSHAVLPCALLNRSVISRYLHRCHKFDSMWIRPVTDGVRAHLAQRESWSWPLIHPYVGGCSRV